MRQVVLVIADSLIEGLIKAKWSFRMRKRAESDARLVVPEGYTAKIYMLQKNSFRICK